MAQTSYSARQASHTAVPPATEREVRLLIAGTLICVLLFNALALWFLANHSPNRGPRAVKMKWGLANHAPEGTNWLILGDSSALRGVVPKILDARLGVRAVNLSTTRRMLVVGNAWLLDRFIAHHGPPQGVLIVHVHEVWHGDRDWLLTELADIPLPWGFWNQMNPPLPLTPREQFRVWLGRYVPIYGDNQSLGDVFRYPWKVARYFHSTGVDETGYMPIKHASPAQVEEDRRRNVEAVRGQVFHISAMNRQALEHIRGLAGQHGFDVYIANSPLYQGLRDDAEFKAYFRQIQAAFQAFAATSPRLHYIAQEPWTFPADQMENCDHVTEPASITYTHKLADEILLTTKNLPDPPASGEGGS